MTKYICCSECKYQEECYGFDPFFGCINGEPKEPSPIVDEKDAKVYDN